MRQPMHIRKTSLLRTASRIAPGILLLSMASPLGLPRAAFAQPPSEPIKYSLDLKGTRLRAALQLLFTNAKVQYALAEDVPDVPVTLNVREQPLDEVLRILLRQVNGSGGQRVTYAREAGVYTIKTVPAVTEPLVMDNIFLTFIRFTEIQDSLKAAFPDVLFVSNSNWSSLVVRGTAGQVQSVRDMVRLLDTAPRTVVLKVEVVLASETGALSAAKAAPAKAKAGPSRSALLSTVLRTGSGQESTGEDRLLGTPAQTSSLRLVATPTRLGDGTYQLATQWDVSLPLSTGKAAVNSKGAAVREGIVRLEKRLSNTSRMRSGETAVAGGIVLSQYGLKGEILFFVTLTEIDPAPAKP